jgi:MFS family permease
MTKRSLIEGVPVRLEGLWRHGDFVRLWSASTVSLFGSLITRTALPFTAILLLDASPSLVGWLTIAGLLPGFLIGLAAGAWLDRRRRRPVMIAADLGRAAVLFSIPVAALVGSLTFPHLLAVAAVVSVLDVTFDVAWQAHLPGIVGRGRLVEANSKVAAAGSVAEAAAFGSGGWLVQLLGAPIAVTIDAVTFLVSALFLRGVRAPERDPAAERAPDAPTPSLLAEAIEGLRVVWRDGRLRALATANLGLTFSFGAFGAAFLVYVSRDLGFSPGVLGLIFALGGVSSFIGAVLAGRIAHLPLGPVIVGCFVVAAVGNALVPLASVGAVGLALLIAQQFVSDPAWTILDINAVSLRQAITADAALGRVNATFRVGEVGGQILGALVGGYVGDAFGARSALWLGVAALAVAAVGLTLSPVRRIRRLPTPATVPEPEIAAA